MDYLLSKLQDYIFPDYRVVLGDRDYEYNLADLREYTDDSITKDEMETAREKLDKKGYILRWRKTYTDHGGHSIMLIKLTPKDEKRKTLKSAAVIHPMVLSEFSPSVQRAFRDVEAAANHLPDGDGIVSKADAHLAIEMLNKLRNAPRSIVQTVVLAAERLSKFGQKPAVLVDKLTGW